MTESTETHELDITRVFDAPRELVFRCMIEPEHLTHFWGPVGVSTPLANITIEPRAGGRFETIMVNDETGEEYPSRGVFVEVVEPEKLVWTEPDVRHDPTSARSPISATAAPRCTSTRPTCPSCSPRPRPGRASTARLDRFAAYLATL